MKNLDIALMLIMLILTTITSYHFYNVLSVYLTDTIGMSDDYLGYVYLIGTVFYAITNILVPKYLCNVFTRR